MKKKEILKLTFPPFVGFEGLLKQEKTPKLDPKRGFYPNSQFTFTIPPSRN